MNVSDPYLQQRPVHALQQCLDSLLSEAQAHCLEPEADEQMSILLARVASACLFLTDKGSHRRCRVLTRYWRGQCARTGTPHHQRMLLKALLRCRESLQVNTPAMLLRRVLADQVSLVIDSLGAPSDSGAAEQRWHRDALAASRNISRAACFLVDEELRSPGPAEQTTAGLLRWLLVSVSSLARDHRGAGVPMAFRRELTRCLARHTVPKPDTVELPAEMPGTASAPGSRHNCRWVLWQLQLLGYALLTVAPILRDDRECGDLHRHCQDMVQSAARGLYLDRQPMRVADCPLRRAVRQALLLASGSVAACPRDTGVDVAATAGLAGSASVLSMAATAVQELQSVIAIGQSSAANWSAISLRLYRLGLCLRMLAGGFGDSQLSQAQCRELEQWQLVLGSLHICANYCLQMSEVVADDQARLLELLHRLAQVLSAGHGPDANDIGQGALLLAARLGLRAQRHWQQLTLDLDAVQQDFAGHSVQQVLAAQLRYLPGLVATTSGPAVLPQDVLHDLRLLLKGARILNVQRIESLVLVLIDVYQQLRADAAFADVRDIRAALPRAHRSLSRMLDQAAAWQTPGNARRMINTLYGCLDRWRASRGLGEAQAISAIAERSVVEQDDPWRQCLATNRRLRTLLQRHDDLDSVRILLLELLRSQEDIIRRQAVYRQASETAG